MKTCSQCHERKPFDAFHRARKNRDGRQGHCKECQHGKDVRRYHANHEANLARSKRTQLARFGLSSEQFASLNDSQSSRCAICELPAEDGKRLAIDHDHSCCNGSGSCGRCVRALLCGSCNGALGFAKDDPDILRRMADYVERHRSLEWLVA